MGGKRTVELGWRGGTVVRVEPAEAEYLRGLEARTQTAAGPVRLALAEEYQKLMDALAGRELLPDPARNTLGRFSDPGRSGAPETQRQAAVLIYYRTGSDKQAVLNAIVDAGGRGMTDFELERRLGLKHQTASARRNDLLNDGWIEDSGQRRTTDSGRPATAWVLTAAGRAQLAGGTFDPEEDVRVGMYDRPQLAIGF